MSSLIQNPQGTGRRWVRPLALLAIGMAFGALTQSWRAPSGVGPDSEVSDDPAHDEHQAAGTGTVEISVEAQEAGAVATSPAIVRVIAPSIQANGVVAADQSRIARIRSLARGVVEEVFVQLGDRVQEGEPLVSYDNIELGVAVGEFLSADADLRRGQAMLQARETVLERSQQMLAVGAIARTEHDIRSARHRDARAQVQAEQARVAQIEEQLHRFGLSEEAIGQLNQGEDAEIHRTGSISMVRAPSAGIVTAHDISPGEAVNESTDLLTITDIAVVWVLAEVYEHDLSLIRVGSDVSVRVPAYPEETFRGRITYIGDSLDLETRAARVRCVVDNSRASPKLGMFATVDIPGSRAVESLAVPSTAIQMVGGRPVVFVKHSDSTFALTEVETGVEAGGWTEIRHGLSEGDTVITGGSFYAKTATLRELIGDHH